MRFAYLSAAPAHHEGARGFGHPFELDVAAVLEQVRPYTLTSDERLLATIDAVDHVVRAGIGGALVECGVWRGGSALAMADRPSDQGSLGSCSEGSRP